MTMFTLDSNYYHMQLQPAMMLFDDDYGYNLCALAHKHA